MLLIQQEFQIKHLLLRAILKFCMSKKLCQWYKKEQLNNVVKIQEKIRTVKVSIRFLKTCQAQHVIPKFMLHCIKAAKVKQTSTMQ